MISGEAARSETGVVANDQALARVFMLEDVGGDGGRHAAHIVEGEVIGDNAAPTVGAEFDF